MGFTRGEMKQAFLELFMIHLFRHYPEIVQGFSDLK
jgi:hypothetical protein